MTTIAALDNPALQARLDAQMKVEQLPLARMNRTKSIYDYQMSTYDQLGKLITKYKDSVDNLAPVFKTTSYKVASSDDKILSTVLTGKDLSIGEHQVQITQLAQAHKINSAAFANKTDAMSIIASLHIDVGNQRLSLVINAEDSMEQIRDHINTSSENPGVVASILTTTSGSGTDEYRLVITAAKTGADNEITLSGAGQDLLDLTHETAAAQDALFSFDGYDVVRSSNTVTDVLDGVTFTLNSANASATINVTMDTQNKKDSVKTAVTSMIDSYNNLIDFIDYYEVGKLTRDSTFGLIKVQLKSIMEQKLGNSGMNRFLDMGIVTAESEERYNTDDVDSAPVKYFTTGKLVIKPAEFDAALNANLDNISLFFTNDSNGFVKMADDSLYDITKVGGSIANREKMISNQEMRIDHSIADEEARLDALKERLQIQFSNLDVFMKRYENLKKYMEIQIASLSSIYTSKR